MLRSLIVLIALAGLLLMADPTAGLHNPTISFDMKPATEPANTYTDSTNTMSVGPVNNCLDGISQGSTHTHSTQLIIQDAEDVVGFQVRMNYIGDRLRPHTWNPTPFSDSTTGQNVGFVNMPIDTGTSAHRDVSTSSSIPAAPTDNTNTPQTAMVGAVYGGSNTFAVSPDTPHKSTPDDETYDAPTGGVLGTLTVQVLGNEGSQADLYIELDDGNPNGPGSGVSVFTGSGVAQELLPETALNDGNHREGFGACSGNPNDPDPDEDGFSTALENSVFSDPNDPCPDAPGLENHAWPPDVNQDTYIDVINDVAEFAALFATNTMSSPDRYDIYPEPTGDSYIDIFDIGRVAALFGQQCTN